MLFSGCKMHCPHKKHLGFNGIFVFHLPSLNKSTYGFCGHKYRPTLRVALTGASLPTAPRFLWRHFSRAKTPQDFSARENRMMTRKRTPAYWRMSRTMTQSAPIFTWGPCKIVRPCRERRTHRSGEGCPKQSAGSARQERRLRPTQKCACPCQAKVFFTPHIYRKECRKQVLFSIPRSHFSAENSSFCPPHFVLFFCPARYSGTASFLAATNFLLRSLNCHNVNLAWVPLIPKAWEYFQLLEP